MGTMLSMPVLREFCEDIACALAEAEENTIMGMPDDIGGSLVPPEYIVSLAVRLGMPSLPDRMIWDARVRAKIRDRPRWWQWLFHNYSTNKIASFLIWRWPKFPRIVAAYDECCQAHQEETEARVQKAYEHLRSRMEKGEAVTVKATIGNFAEYRYCTMKVAGNDESIRRTYMGLDCGRSNAQEVLARVRRRSWQGNVYGNR